MNNIRAICRLSFNDLLRLSLFAACLAFGSETPAAPPVAPPAAGQLTAEQQETISRDLLSVQQARLDMQTAQAAFTKAAAKYEADLAAIRKADGKEKCALDVSDSWAKSWKCPDPAAQVSTK